MVNLEASMARMAGETEAVGEGWFGLGMRGEGDFGSRTPASLTDFSAGYKITWVMKYSTSNVYNRLKDEKPHLHPTSQPVVFGRAWTNNFIHELIDRSTALARVKIPTPGTKHWVVALG